MGRCGIEDMCPIGACVQERCDKGLDAAAKLMVRRGAIIALKALQRRSVVMVGEGSPTRWELKL
jgi:hypothetical protein